MSHWVRNLVVNAVRKSRNGKMPASIGSNWRVQVKRASSSPALTFLKLELARALLGHDQVGCDVSVPVKESNLPESKPVWVEEGPSHQEGLRVQQAMQKF